jgi:hypothetical protein
MAPALPVLGLAGGVFSALGTIQQGEAQKNALNYQSQVAANNAVMARQAADYEAKVTGQRVAVSSMKGAADIGTLKATQGASGVTVGTGSSRRVVQSATELEKLNTLTEQQKGQAKEYGYRQQATNFQAQSGLYGYEAPQALTGAELGAAGTALGTSAKWLIPAGGSTGSGTGGLY